MEMRVPHQELFEQKSRQVADLYATLPEVAAVAIAGSHASGVCDAASDLDLYVYTTSEIPQRHKADVIEQSGGTMRSELGLPYWGGTDVWVDAESGITVDCLFFSPQWIEEQITRIMDMHEPRLGYTTCFCRTVALSEILYDPHGWFAELQIRSRKPYPETLRTNIILHNHPVLRRIIPSYMHQIELALHRCDVVSVNHRVAGLLASYFDILFALNRVLHPGEKRLLDFSHRECALVPEGMDTDVAATLAAAGVLDEQLLSHLERLIDRLELLLEPQGFVTRKG